MKKNIEQHNHIKTSFNSLLRTIAVVTVCMFTWTTIALADPGRVYRINVPASYGKIKQRYKGTSDKTVIHIQHRPWSGPLG